MTWPPYLPGMQPGMQQVMQPGMQPGVYPGMQPTVYTVVQQPSMYVQPAQNPTIQRSQYRPVSLCDCSGR